MLTNYHTLSYVASSLGPHLLGNAISEAFSQEKDQLVLKFESRDSALIFSTHRILNTLWLRPEFFRARANSVDVLHGCIGKMITDVRMHAIDRVILFTLNDGTRLDARFFGAKSNVVHLDASGNVVDAFKDAKSVVGAPSEYRQGELVYDFDALRSRLSTPQLATIQSIMKEEFPTLGATLVKEVLHRAGVRHNIGAMSVSPENVDAIQAALSSVLAQLARPYARVYLVQEGDKKGMPEAFSLIPLAHLDNVDENRFDDVHEAIRFYISRYLAQENVEDQKRSLAGRLNQKLGRMKRTIDAVEADLRSNSRAEEYQQFGTLLMSNLNSVEPGKARVELDGVTIPLQKELSAVQNAQRYFEKAKRSRTAQQQSAERLAELRASIAPGERLLTVLHAVETKDDLKVFMSANKEDLEEFGIGPKSERREQLPFRVFTVDGGFEVWAGKSSKNNDELTLKYAKPNDLWFHARGAAGSHVVLKVNTGKGEPGKKAKEQAAGIAAYYSKMKNAKMVPVAMTEKKFVRKPKGASPGTVTVEREKVILAEPALPQPEK